MILRLLPPGPANDNFTPWQQGRADGKARRWSEDMANKGGSRAQEYLAGWIAAHEECAPQPPPRED